jgi:hypothetical protein|tara:strand:+ start:361 stop:603 length:243 start_codon:yes stop_codon:yes gene_type:complete
MTFESLGIPSIVLLFWIPILIWEAVWKGIGMWKAARNSQLGWFIAILIVNSAGILPIVYIYFFQKDNKPNKTIKKSKKKK